MVCIHATPLKGGQAFVLRPRSYQTVLYRPFSFKKSKERTNSSGDILDTRITVEKILEVDATSTIDLGHVWSIGSRHLVRVQAQLKENDLNMT